MNTEQWKALRQECINKMRSVLAADKQATTASNKERKQLEIHPEKKTFWKKKITENC